MCVWHFCYGVWPRFSQDKFWLFPFLNFYTRNGLLKGCKVILSRRRWRGVITNAIFTELCLYTARTHDIIFSNKFQGEEYQKERLGVYTQIPGSEEDGKPIYARYSIIYFETIVFIWLYLAVVYFDQQTGAATPRLQVKICFCTDFSTFSPHFEKKKNNEDKTCTKASLKHWFTPKPEFSTIWKWVKNVFS